MGIPALFTSSTPPVGGELPSNPIVRKLTCSGSSEVGKLLTEQCAGEVEFEDAIALKTHASDRL